MIDVPANCTTDSVVCTSLNSQTQNLLPPLSGSCTLVLCCKVQCLQVVQLSWQLATDSYSISMYFCLLLCASPGKFELPSFLIVSSHSSGFFVFFGGDQWSVTVFFFGILAPQWPMWFCYPPGWAETAVDGGRVGRARSFWEYSRKSCGSEFLNQIISLQILSHQ